MLSLNDAIQSEANSKSSIEIYSSRDHDLRNSLWQIDARVIFRRRLSHELRSLINKHREQVILIFKK